VCEMILLLYKDESVLNGFITINVGLIPCLCVCEMFLILLHRKATFIFYILFRWSGCCCFYRIWLLLAIQTDQKPFNRYSWISIFMVMNLLRTFSYVWSNTNTSHIKRPDGVRPTLMYINLLRTIQDSQHPISTSYSVTMKMLWLQDLNFLTFEHDVCTHVLVSQSKVCSIFKYLH
jgi:hypothetical protein